MRIGMWKEPTKSGIVKAAGKYHVTLITTSLNRDGIKRADFAAIAKLAHYFFKVIIYKEQSETL